MEYVKAKNHLKNRVAEPKRCLSSIERNMFNQLLKRKCNFNKQQMEIIIKKYPAILLGIATAFSSCSNDNDNLEQNDFDGKSYDMVATYNNVKVGQDNDGVYNYFIDEQLQYKVVYNQSLSKSSEPDFTLNIIDANTIRIENTNDNSEYYELRNVNTVNSSKIFDIYTSDGQLLPNVELNSTLVQAKCPWCWATAGAIAIVEAIIEGTTDSDCQTAIKECREAGGLPTTEIEDGFFGTSCKVTCNPKPE